MPDLAAKADALAKSSDDKNADLMNLIIMLFPRY